VKVIALSILAIVAALSLAGVYFAVAAVPGAIAEFEREPEDLTGLVVFTCLGLFLFGYCVAGIAKAMRRAYRIGVSGYVSSAFAALLSAVMFVSAAFDGSENVILGILIALCVGAYVYLGRFSAPAVAQ
jgi:hypothetical protein